ncbi:hypothetical protein GW17_00009516 [Ensete ventricosum]|nr:hypothetical protein GW17_00009516 [Ensete ventricosum]
MGPAVIVTGLTSHLLTTIKVTDQRRKCRARGLEREPRAGEAKRRGREIGEGRALRPPLLEIESDDGRSSLQQHPPRRTRRNRKDDPWSLDVSNLTNYIQKNIGLTPEEKQLSVNGHNWGEIDING